MEPERAPENHALIIGTSRFGQPLAVYRNRTYELMPVGLDAGRNATIAPDDPSETPNDALPPDEDTSS